MTSEWLHYTLHSTQYTLQLKDNKIAQSCYHTKNINCIRRQRCYASLTIWSDVAGVLMKKLGYIFLSVISLHSAWIFLPIGCLLKAKSQEGQTWDYQYLLYLPTKYLIGHVDKM